MVDYVFSQFLAFEKIAIPEICFNNSLDFRDISRFRREIGPTTIRRRDFFMARTPGKAIIGFLILAGLLAAFSNPCNASSHPRYDITDLGTLGEKLLRYKTSFAYGRDE